MSQTLLSLAGFQVILSGRFWVIAEVRVSVHRKSKWTLTTSDGRQGLGSDGFRSCDDVPGQQFLNTIDGMVGDALQYLAHMRLRVEAVQLRTNQDGARDAGSLAGLG
jgi:hypothetical protein